MRQGELIAEGTPSQLRARLNGRILELCGSPLREMSTVAARDPGVEDVRLFGDRLHLRTLAGKSAEVINRLGENLPEAGCKLDSIRQVPANLEDVFIVLSEQGASASKAALDLPTAHEHALKILLERIPPEKYGWLLTGSASLHLQGVDVTVHDLDIECSPQDILKIEQALSGYIKTPVHEWETERVRSLDGKADIGGVEIELIAELEFQDPDGSYKVIKDFEHKIWLEWQNLQVPVLPLEEEAAFYKKTGRDEKADLIQATIRRFKEGRRD